MRLSAQGLAIKALMLFISFRSKMRAAAFKP